MNSVSAYVVQVVSFDYLVFKGVARILLITVKWHGCFNPIEFNCTFYEVVIILTYRVLHIVRLVECDRLSYIVNPIILLANDIDYDT